MARSASSEMEAGRFDCDEYGRGSEGWLIVRRMVS
jgi:hypothetical protein